MNIDCMHSIGRGFCLYVVLVIVTVVLSGCPVPIVRETEKPERFSLLDIERLNKGIGITTREEIQSVFGKPDISRYDDKLWIYGWAREATTFELKYEYGRVLFIEFDAEGVLRDIDLEEGEEACRDDGVCVRHWDIREQEWGDYVIHIMNIWRLNEFLTIVTAPISDSERVKNYVPGEGVCGVYIFGDTRFAIGNLRDIRVDKDRFVFIEMERGEKEILLYIGQLSTAQRNPDAYALESKKFDCRSGENVYIDVRQKIRIFPIDLDWIVIFQPSDIGRKSINDKQLILLADTAEDNTN